MRGERVRGADDGRGAPGILEHWSDVLIQTVDEAASSEGRSPGDRRTEAMEKMEAAKEVM